MLVIIGVVAFIAINVGTFVLLKKMSELVERRNEELELIVTDVTLANMKQALENIRKEEEEPPSPEQEVTRC